MAIEIGTVQRDEKLTRAQRARIGTHTIEGVVGTDQTTAHHAGQFGQRERAHAAPLCNTAWTRSISLNFSRRPAIS